MSLAGVLGGQEEELGADQVGGGVVDLGAEEDDPLLEQTAIDVGGPVKWSRLGEQARKQVRHVP